MVIWPILSEEIFECIDNIIIFMNTIVGIIMAVPIMIGLSIFRILCWIFKRVASLFYIYSNIIFSKEEKVQIALGTIEKERKQLKNHD